MYLRAPTTIHLLARAINTGIAGSWMQAVWPNLTKFVAAAWLVFPNAYEPRQPPIRRVTRMQAGTHGVSRVESVSG
jgi:hypothetical protein